jgi:hypothetical protein
MPDSAQPVDPLESYFSAHTLSGLIRSGLTFLKARNVRLRSEMDTRRFNVTDIGNQVLYFTFIVAPAIMLDAYQRARTAITKRLREYPRGSWQFYLGWRLREDPGKFTVETEGYHKSHPPEATELDDITAWVMALIQFLWGYEELMGVVWDEWVMLRLVNAAAVKAGLEYDQEFVRLQRQWEVVRPYGAPLNGTYADVRRAAFQEFIKPRYDALPREWQRYVTERYEAEAASRRAGYQKQMSLLARLAPGRYMDTKRTYSAVGCEDRRRSRRAILPRRRRRS